MAFLGGGPKESPEMKLVKENIASVEEKIQEKIFQLGQMYYDDHKGDNNTDDRYHGMIDAIIKLNLNRTGFYKNKLRLQGQMMCENCEAIIPYGSVYCSSCGKRADEKQEGGAAENTSDSLKCKNCGAALVEGSIFCSSCGKRTDERQERDATESTPDSFKCGNCGAVLETGNIFCTSCGTKVE